MKWYVCLGVICILLAVCSYNMYNRYEQEDIEIETVLIKMSEENERKRQELNYDYLEILIRSEKELMEYKDLYDFLKDLTYVNWEEECIIVTSYPVERFSYKRKNKHNKYYLLDILYKNRNRNVYAITGKNYIQYDTAGMYKEPEFKYCLKASATKIWISILRINILFDKIREIIFSKCKCCIGIIIET